MIDVATAASTVRGGAVPGSRRPPRRRRFLAAICLHLAVAVAAAAARAGLEGPAVAGVLSADAVWEGRITVEKLVTVPAGVTLTVRPGAEIGFLPGASLLVEGTLLAGGTAERPIRFVARAEDPAPGVWGGIVLRASGVPSLLRHCVVAHADCISIAAGSPLIEACEIRDAVRGIVVSGKGTEPRIAGNRLVHLREAGVDCLAGAAPRIERNTIERAGTFGIGASATAVPVVVGNAVTGSTAGIVLENTAPALRDNTLAYNGSGLILTRVNGGRPIQGNVIVGNDIGIYCQQLSYPEISGNVIRGNRQGVVCSMGAHPLLRNNEVSGGESGIVADQIAYPTVSANEIRGNQRGLYLNLSSYARVNGNNIVDNDVQFELGNMSSDWERRVGKKPARGFQRQGSDRLNQGVGQPQAAREDGAVIDAAVDATGNWWGEATTREMEEKGPEANISTLVDFHDVPTRTYEGFPGQFEQDRIRYAPWAKAPIAGAGPPPHAAPALPEPP